MLFLGRVEVESHGLVWKPLRHDCMSGNLTCRSQAPVDWFLLGTSQGWNSKHLNQRWEVDQGWPGNKRRGLISEVWCSTGSSNLMFVDRWKLGDLIPFRMMSSHFLLSSPTSVLTFTGFWMNLKWSVFLFNGIYGESRYWFQGFIYSSLWGSQVFQTPATKYIIFFLTLFVTNAIDHMPYSRKRTAIHMHVQKMIYTISVYKV